MMVDLKEPEAVAVERGDANVFRDLGLPDADALLVKAELAIAIMQIIETKGWTQTEAAQVLGLSQARVSALNRGKLEGFSFERLFRCLNRLKIDVSIVLASAINHPAEVILAQTVSGQTDMVGASVPSGQFR